MTLRELSVRIEQLKQSSNDSPAIMDSEIQVAVQKLTHGTNLALTVSGVRVWMQEACASIVMTTEPLIHGEPNEQAISETSGLLGRPPKGD